jgi:hypothetical protein
MPQGSAIYCAPQESFKQLTNSITHGGLLYVNKSNIVYEILHFTE